MAITRVRRRSHVELPAHNGAAQICESRKHRDRLKQTRGTVALLGMTQKCEANQTRVTVYLENIQLLFLSLPGSIIYLAFSR